MNSALIYNVRILTMEDGSLSHGWLQISEGKISAIGMMETCPQDLAAYDTVLDGQGGWLLPGFVDAHSHLGLYEDSLGFEGADGNEDTDPVTPQLRALDGINPADRAFRDAVCAGVTTVAVSPGSANPIGGQIVAMKTCGRRVDNMIIRQPVAMKFALGENPKLVYHDKEETPVTRMATAAILREQLYKAQEYLARKERTLMDEDADDPDYDLKMEALIPVLRREIGAHFHAHRADDIFTALRIAEEFCLSAVIIHGTEAHLVADLLGGENVSVISGPFLTDRSKPELKELTEKAPGILNRQGIMTAITTDHPETPERLLLNAAMLAVRAGMDEDAAFQSITINGAKILGIDKRVGSLKEGKDGDCVLFSGHPFDYKTKVEAVFCDGVLQYRREPDEGN